jgi:hypothetical protein
MAFQSLWARASFRASNSFLWNSGKQLISDATALEFRREYTDRFKLSGSIAVYYPQAPLVGGSSDGKFVVRLIKDYWFQ